MFRHLFLIVVGLLILTACAKPPTETLQSVRRSVAYAYAAGAASLAPEQYQVASGALQEAEQLVRDGKYQQAEMRLGLARRYGQQALQITLERKEVWQEQERQRRLAEAEARAEAERKAAEERERQKEKAQQQLQAAKPKPKPRPESPPEKVLLDSVQVADGETLGSISAREDVYEDVLLWPLIYKANRDQIKDPQEIFSGQVLLIPRDKSADEIEAARQEARELNLF